MCPDIVGVQFEYSAGVLVFKTISRHGALIQPPKGLHALNHPVSTHDPARTAIYPRAFTAGSGQRQIMAFIDVFFGQKI